MDEDLVVLKVDMRNTVNMVSRQALVDEYATFPLSCYLGCLGAMNPSYAMAPIGDYINCIKFITGKCAESRKLLAGLVDIAAIDLQVAVILLCMCG